VVGLLVSVITIGSVFYWRVEHWTLLDAIYFSVVTVRAVGFGDLSLHTRIGKIFTIFYVLISIGIIGIFVNAFSRCEIRTICAICWPKWRRLRHKRRWNPRLRSNPIALPYALFAPCGSMQRGVVRGTVAPAPRCRRSRAIELQEKVVRVQDTMTIEKDGNKIAAVKGKIIDPVRDRWEIHIEGGHDLSAHGNLVGHEYSIDRDDRPVALISKKWFRVRDSYGIEITDAGNFPLILACAVCIDMMSQ
jgi:hypothetical protein